MNVELVAMTQVTDSYLNKLMKECTEDNKEFIKKIQTPDGLMAYLARVSSPNPTSPESYKLLKYCAKNSHWSIFEQVDITFEVETSRAISAQLIRHKTLFFQEFSQRYIKADLGFEKHRARRQDSKNRQNSIDDMSNVEIEWFDSVQDNIQEISQMYYGEALKRGIAKEQARFLLPMSTKTKLFAKGPMRSWIHYINVRTDKSTQAEHREIALKIKELLIEQFPETSKAVGWIE